MHSASPATSNGIFQAASPSCPACSPRRGGFAQTRAGGLMTGYVTKTGICATLAPTAPTATSNPLTFAPAWASPAPCISTLSLEDPEAGRMAKYMTTNSVAQAEAPLRLVPARPLGPMAPYTTTSLRRVVLVERVTSSTWGTTAEKTAPAASTRSISSGTCMEETWARSASRRQTETRRGRCGAIRGIGGNPHAVSQSVGPDHSTLRAKGGTVIGATPRSTR